MPDYFEKILSPRRAAIVRAVLKLADDYGFQKITTKNIAAEVGFAEGALYRHVKSKEDIFELIIGLSRKMIAERLKQIKSLPNALEKIGNFFYYSLDFLEQFPGIYHIIFSSAYYPHKDKLFAKFNELLQEIQLQIARIIDGGKKSGQIRSKFESVDLAIGFLGILHNSFILWDVFRKRSISLREVAQPFFEQYRFLLKGE